MNERHKDLRSQQTRTSPLRQRGFAYGRLLYWTILAVWAVVSWNVAGPLAEFLPSRVNDLAVIPGAGAIMRDPAGTFYHVNSTGRARAIYPQLAPPVYQQACLDCMLVTGEQLSQTKLFCVSGEKATLPTLTFESPCRTWAPLGEGQQIIAFCIFIVPLLLYWIVRAIVQRADVPRPQKITRPET